MSGSSVSGSTASATALPSGTSQNRPPGTPSGSRPPDASSERRPIPAPVPGAQIRDALAEFGGYLRAFPGVLRQPGHHGQLADIPQHRITRPAHHVEAIAFCELPVLLRGVPAEPLEVH